jgi:hypothetical protein
MGPASWDPPPGNTFVGQPSLDPPRVTRLLDPTSRNPPVYPTGGPPLFASLEGAPCVKPLGGPPLGTSLGGPILWDLPI